MNRLKLNVQNIEICILSKLLHRFQPNFEKKTKDHQVLIVGGPNTPSTNPRWRTAAILEKKIKSRYLSNHLTDFDEIWHADAEPISSPHRPLKIRTLKMVDVSHSDANCLTNSLKHLKFQNGIKPPFQKQDYLLF